MIVRITRLLLLIQLLAGIGIYLLARNALRVDPPALAGALSLAAVLLVRLIITANNFALAWRYRSETPVHYRIGWWQACKLFLGEYRATMTASSWTMSFRTFSRYDATHPSGLPVLLIHGYGCNSGYWHPMSKVLRAADITHHAIDMEPVIGSIDDYVPLIHRAVERLCQETQQDRIVIVAHSMGGLAARAYLRDHGCRRIAKLITLGTPHHGTALAHFGVGVNTHQMRWTAAEQEGLASEWLRKLAASEDPSCYRLLVSIYSHQDNIISPQNSSHLEGAKNIEFHAVGHVALGFDPRVQAQVVQEIRSAATPVSLAAASA
ncbi:alpha/beta fold hydrolase [Herbaspirillum sp. ST 5-3]|uniref:esterase/lipase family protein n=1 Tax=Oxalobacteraceae TaxID=75682 RepID=UPI0010A4831B|nr:alpha/beta fold hydrolase [Herbaspirillum sp. ST 5-3]